MTGSESGIENKGSRRPGTQGLPVCRSCLVISILGLGTGVCSGSSGLYSGQWGLGEGLGEASPAWEGWHEKPEFRGLGSPR